MSIATNGALAPPRGDGYKWVALSNTTLGIMMATINQGILLISLPDIFRGIHLQPLAAGNTAYFLWILMGYMLITAVLVVSLGRVGDQYGRVRMYNLGFAVFTVFSVLLSVTWLTGSSGALWLICMRIGQGIGASFLFANSSAILTDAFPESERGMAMGINGAALVTGSFLGLILGGVLGPVEWHLVFLVSVPFGLFGTVWAYLKLQDNGVRIKSSIDWLGNITFGVGLTSLLIGIVYGIQPYGGHTMGWTSPFVLGTVAGGLVLLGWFVAIELRVPNPMFDLKLFRLRAYAAGVGASFLSAIGRGGFQFILIIWLQGIWLPQHGYDFSQTPLWAGIYMIPLMVGFLVVGPVAGVLTDRLGARGLSTVGMVGVVISYLLLEIVPMNFRYLPFAGILLLFSISSGLFVAPNQTAVMNSLPPDRRGAGAGMNGTAQNVASVLSIGVFFSIITLGLASSLPSHLYDGLVAQGMPRSAAHHVATLPPIGSLFAAFLGFNPIKTLVSAKVLAGLGPGHAAYITGRSFFPKLISPSFQTGLRYAFDFAALATGVAAVCCWLRGGRVVPSVTHSLGDEVAVGLLDVGELASSEFGVGVGDDAIAPGGLTEASGELGNGNGNGLGTPTTVPIRGPRASGV